MVDGMTLAGEMNVDGVDVSDPEVRTLLEVDARWYAAYPPRDLDEIRRIMAPGFFGSLYENGHFEGNAESEVRFVAEVVPDLEALPVDVIKVQVWGDTGVVLCRTRPLYADKSQQPLQNPRLALVRQVRRSVAPGIRPGHPHRRTAGAHPRCRDGHRDALVSAADGDDVVEASPSAPSTRLRAASRPATGSPSPIR